MGRAGPRPPVVVHGRRLRLAAVAPLPEQVHALELLNVIYGHPLLSFVAAQVVGSAVVGLCF